MAASDIRMVYNIVKQMRDDVYVEIREKVYVMFIEEMKKNDNHAWINVDWPDPLFQKIVNLEFSKQVASKFTNALWPI